MTELEATKKELANLLNESFKSTDDKINDAVEIIKAEDAIKIERL